MLMIIFGAGASYDSDPVHPIPSAAGTSGGRLPLARDLFWSGYGKFAASYPACQGLMTRLRAAAPNVEPELERIRAEAKKRTYLLRQLEGVRYYLRALIHESEDNWFRVLVDHVTTYTNLLEEVEGWREESDERLALVTFNYDCLLDHACRSVIPGLRLARVADFAGRENHSVFKLHGSIDWNQGVSFSETRVLMDPALDTENRMIDDVMITHPTGQYWRDGEQAPKGVPGYGYARPAIAIPMVTKGGNDFACPADHVSTLRQIIPSVTNLIVVGWRGEEEHFHDLWREAERQGGVIPLRRMLVVDASEEAAQGVLDRLKAALKVPEGVAAEGYGGGFAAALQQGVFSRFLGAYRKPA